MWKEGQDLVYIYKKIRCKCKYGYHAPFYVRMGIFRIYVHVANISINKYWNGTQKNWGWS